ncbi:hypothetical protein HER10_EVM0011318 [Colletotrichum scovillei]|uniref:Uncharacterized protein n=1 Tax=Colletotrichum scovillei TaxID=1209932 RepID=A0A9P7R9U6_9PEZI|nr:uncharacterized protein HER10_EVM0011318 [Colletotrichum scovillei]KAF4783561.1 hypothetical protein HER10_EVM0011318 [Colletotrichum scovillei]KAG7051341.1 hypothetical protein JMJ77_0001965 [Colletotrichum scovillei]KAG7070378.1 hypothetical protein JMJ76_0001631 [Colletotrichum scovillei]KAG7078650.1 hypothetical protein JMJ78_0002319 [Colletotrichum scovillei]
MSSDLKNVTQTSNFEVDSDDAHYPSHPRLLKTVDTARVSLTAVALLMGITILGTSADALAVYDATHVPAGFMLPLWPDAFDLRPTVALVVGSSILIIINLVSLLFSRVQSLRGQTLIHNSLAVAAPSVGLVASIIAMSFFYSVNASITVDTLQSWSCRWSDVVMMTRPHFGTLCKQSKAGLYLSILLIPIEAIIVGMGGYQMMLERNMSKSNRVVLEQRKSGSPAPSSVRDVEGDHH